MTEKKSTEKTLKKEFKKVFVTGTLTKMRWERGYKGKGEEAWRISVKLDKPVSDDAKKEVLKTMAISSDDIFCPKWLKDSDVEYINVHTIFDIPCRLKGSNGSYFEIAMNEVFEGAVVKIGLKVKKGGVYPFAMQIEKNGVPYNPFEDFGGED